MEGSRDPEEVAHADRGMEGSVKYQYAPGAQSWGPDGTMQEESIDGEAEEGGV